MGNVLDRIRKYQVDQASQNTDSMFWTLFCLASVLFMAVAAWKFFYFQQQISAPILFWERFLEFSAAAASEAFRLGSLGMAYHESKKGRPVTVWFGILVSIGIMAYDMHLGALVASETTYETYLFICGLSELVGIRAVFGYAFEDFFVSWTETSLPEKQTGVSMPVPERPQPKPKPEPAKIIETHSNPDHSTDETNGFDEDLAQQIIEKHNLSVATLRTWRYRQSIPEKYLT